jgi:hypothetical protein
MPLDRPLPENVAKLARVLATTDRVAKAMQEE